MKEFFDQWVHELGPWLMAHGVKIVLIIIGGYIFNKLAKGLIEKTVRLTVTRYHHATETAEKKREETLIRIFSWSTTLVIVLIVFMMILQQAGVPIGPMLAGAGIVGLAVGFGGQYLVRDFITGFFMIMENQYRIGDVVNFDGTSGLVEDISLRMTTLRDMDGTVHHVPHGDIRRVANLSKDFARINLDINVAYGANLEKTIEVINRTGSEMVADPAWKDMIIKPPQFLRIDNFSDTGVIVKVVGETVPLKQWEITGELRKRIKVAFDREGIEIPVTHRVIQYNAKPGDI